ncbi:hypothetical protein ACEPPN_014377 [Leptodophora sp. 'Broadleaf-Isolate-01']
MSVSSMDVQPWGKKQDPAPASTAGAPATLVYPQASHSQGLSAFLTQFSGAYASNDASVIRGAQSSLVAILKTEKKIEKRRVEVKEGNEFAESFDKTLDVKGGAKDESEMEIDVKGTGKKGKENCCGCGGCDEF